MKKLLKYISLVLIVVIAFLGYQTISISGVGMNSDNPGKLITHNLVDPSRLSEVSKFRSEAGHDFGGRGEKCLSMKHYFVATFDVAKKTELVQSGGTINPPDGNNDIVINAPFDGYVTQVAKNKEAGFLIGLVPAKNKGVVLILDHVYGVKKGLHAGPIPFFPFLTSTIKAGEPIAKINSNEGFDVELRVGGVPWSDNWASYFTALTDQAAREWQLVKNVPLSDYIISKSYRQAHSLQCMPYPDHPDSNNQQFVHPAAANDENNYVILKPTVFKNIEENLSPRSDSGVACDKNHLGVIRTTPQGKLKCRLVADGRITWGPLEG